MSGLGKSPHRLPPYMNDQGYRVTRSAAGEVLTDSLANSPDPGTGAIEEGAGLGPQARTLDGRRQWRGRAGGTHPRCGPMSAGQAVAAAVMFVWLGMVLAISFLEAP